MRVLFGSLAERGEAKKAGVVAHAIAAVPVHAGCARGLGRFEDRMFRGLDCLSPDCRNSVVDCVLIWY